MKVMHVAVLPIAVVVQPGKQYGTACAATGGCRESVREQHALVGKSIEMGRSNDRIPIRAHVLSMIVGDEKNDVAVGESGWDAGCITDRKIRSAAGEPGQEDRKGRPDLEGQAIYTTHNLIAKYLSVDGIKII